MHDVQVTATIHAVERKLESYKAEYESINHSINTFRNQIEELSKKPDVPADFLSFKNATESFVRDLTQKQATNRSLIDSIRVEFDLLKAVVQTHEQKIRLAGDSIPLLDSKIVDVKDQLSQKIVSISTAFCNRFNEHAEHQKKQIESYSSQVLAAPKSVMESNNTILEKLEVATLDASNSMMKVNNLELSMKLWERKFENLAIQVKKLELTQQA